MKDPKEGTMADKKEDSRKPPLGSGERFAALKKQLSTRKGVTDPGALSAAIGRRRYGAAKMSAMAAAGRKEK